MKVQLLAPIMMLLLALAVPLTTRSVAAAPGRAVDDPGNIWAPYGPYAPGQPGLASKVLLKYYPNPASEFNDFVAGKLDLTDWPQPKSSYSLYDSNPDFQLSPTQGQYALTGIYFNAADNVFTSTTGYQAAGLDAADSGGPWWGCDWNTGAVGTTDRQTYVTPCGIEMRQAFLHLVDRPIFASSLPAQALADPSPPAKDPSASSHAEQCSWETIPAGTNIMGHIVPTTCISAYNYGNDPSGFAISGSIDFCMAAQHMINAGIAVTLNSDCSIAAVNTTNIPGGLGQLTSHPLKGMVRNNDPNRLALGNRFIAALNSLFGASVAFPAYGTIQTLGPIVFDEFPEGQTADWSFYTFQYGLGGPFPDHLYDLYSTEDASNYCGGPVNPEPDNPTFVCLGQIPTSTPSCTVGSGCTFEQAVNRTISSASIPDFRAATLDAFHEYGLHATDMAAYSVGIRVAALTAVKGLVNLRGDSYGNVLSTMGYQDPFYSPVNPIYTFGGGDPTTLRYGQSQGLTQLNIFHVSTIREFQALGEIYDTLFTASPVELTKVYCNMCNVDPNFPAVTPKIDPVTGDAHFLVRLKNNLRWQDGVPVDAYDVAFSLLSCRDYCPRAGGAISLFKTVHVLSSTTVDIEFLGNNISYPIDLEAFIFPRHIWECTSDNTCAVSGGSYHFQYIAAGINEPSVVKRSYGFDPVAAGALIGSGPFACVSLSGPDTGRVGTGCARDANNVRFDHQNIPVGGTMLLQSFDFVKNQGVTDPYYQYMRSVDSNWGTGATSVAAESGQFNEFKYADFDHNTQVDSGDIAKIAVCVGATGPTDPNHTICTSEPGNGYVYWTRTVFETTPGTIGGEFAIVAGQFGTNYVSPYAWNSDNLENIVRYP